MKIIWELQKKSQLTNISYVKVNLYQLKNNGLVVLLKESRLPMQISLPFCQMNLTTPPTPVIPHSTSLVFFLPYSHCSCPSSTKLMGHITTKRKTASLSPPTDAISLLETVEGGKMVFKSLFTTGIQNFLGKI